jgi:hypothetical protein
MALNVSASVLYMVFFGHFIAPGHDAKYYQDHIQAAGPYCSIVAGIPLMFLAGLWVTGWWQQAYGINLAIGVAIAYVLLDLAILFAVGMILQILLLLIVSYSTKLAAAWSGAIVRRRQLQCHSKVHA